MSFCSYDYFKLVFPFVQFLFMKIIFVAERYIHGPIYGPRI